MLKFLNSFSIIILISVLIIIVGEFFLWSLWSLTKSSKLDTIEGNKIFKINKIYKNNKYPKNPENFLKIAVLVARVQKDNILSLIIQM